MLCRIVDCSWVQVLLVTIRNQKSISIWKSHKWKESRTWVFYRSGNHFWAFKYGSWYFSNSCIHSAFRGCIYCRWKSTGPIIHWFYYDSLKFKHIQLRKEVDEESLDIDTTTSAPSDSDENVVYGIYGLMIENLINYVLIQVSLFFFQCSNSWGEEK